MFRVNGKYLDREDIIFDYRCKACGGELYSCEGGIRYQCKDCKQFINDASGLTTKPYKPTPALKRYGNLHFPVDRCTLPFVVVVKDYTCACGAPLEIDGETLRCAGPGRHVIHDGDDVKSKYARIESFSDADAFVEGYLFWNEGEATMAGRLKDRTTISTGLKRAGKVRLGYKVALLDDNGKPRKYRGGPMQGQPVYKPVNVDYFVLKDAPAVAEAYADHPSVIKDKYGSGPTELLVFLPFDEANRIFEARYEWRKGPILYCAGDGEFIDYALSADGLNTVVRNGFAAQDYHDDEWSLSKGAQVACSGMGAMGDGGLWPRCANCTAHDGKAAMTLRVMVRDPENPMTVVKGEMAYYEIHTSSNVTYDLLVEQIDKYAGEAARAGGKLTGIPFRLTRVPTEMSYVQKDRSGAPVKRAVVEHALMNIEPDPEWVKAMTIFSYQRAVMLDEPDAPAPIEYALPAGNGSKGEDEQVVEPQSDVADDDGVIEGEFSESGEGEPEPESEALDPRTTPRPWPPELLKSVFQHNVAKRAEKGGNAGHFYPQEKRQTLVGRVDDLFDGDPAKRRAFLEYVFGVTSSAQMTVAMADVLENWLGSNGHTGAEALAVVALEGDEEQNIDDFLGSKRGVREQFEEDADAEQAGLPGMEAA